MTCRKCGFPSKPEDEIVIYGVLQHRDCFGAMIDLVSAAQAEAALRATERDRAIDRALSVEMQLEAAKTELKSTHDFYDLAIGVAQAHEARIDELKAQLAALQAAGQWRPVTERPPTDVTIEMIVVGLYRGNNEFWDESFGAMVEPTHWRPAPPTEPAQ